MRRLILAVLLLLPSLAGADFIRYYPAQGGTFTGGTLTTPVLGIAADSCAAIPFSFVSDTNTGLCSTAADTWNLYTAGASRLSGNSTAVTSTVPLVLPQVACNAANSAISFEDPNSGLCTQVAKSVGFTIDGSEKLRVEGTAVSIFNAYLMTYAEFLPSAIDARDIGRATTLPFRHLFFNTSTQGAKSKALADAAATAFVRIAIPQTVASRYAGGQVIYTIFCSDATNTATSSGTVKFACQNVAGTESCGFGTPDVVALGDGTAAIGTTTFDAATGAADTIDLRVSSDCTGVTPTTLTIQYRLDMPQPNTVTPQ